MMNTVSRLICLFFGHKYVLTQKLSTQSRRLCCARCNRMFAMNDDVRAVVEWDADFHRLYEKHGVKIIYQEWEGRNE